MPSRLLVLVVASALVVAACGDSSSTGSSDGPAQAWEAETEPDGARSGAGSGDGQLLALSAPTISGGTVDLGERAGSDLVLWFWAPW